MYRALGFAHATAYHHLDRARRSAAAEHGQGTVEYIGLILLIAAIMGFVVGGGHGKELGGKVYDEIKNAIDGLGPASKS
jgi:hypothetical protein